MFTLVLLAATAAPAAPPKFTVENRIPQKFEVENRIPAKTAPKKTLCGCAFTNECTCWETECACSSCGQGGAASKTFRSGQYNPSHTCPNPKCGFTSPARTGTWIVSGNGPQPGTHQHTCPRCGTSWWHRDQ